MTSESDSQRSRAHVYLLDHLARDRTILANERTLLAYIRTALTFFIAGATFIKFFDHPALEVIGWVFLPMSFMIAAIGSYSYRRTRKVIVSEVSKAEQSDQG